LWLRTSCSTQKVRLCKSCLSSSRPLIGLFDVQTIDGRGRRFSRERHQHSMCSCTQCTTLFSALSKCAQTSESSCILGNTKLFLQNVWTAANGVLFWLHRIGLCRPRSHHWHDRRNIRLVVCVFHLLKYQSGLGISATPCSLEVISKILTLKKCRHTIALATP
jgi:hypothetical protein